MVIAPVVLSAALLMRAPSAVAPPHGYAFASAAFAGHPPSDVHYRDVAFSVGGHARDLSGGGGAFVFQRVLGIEGEFLYGGAVSTPQYTSFDEKARDIMLNALVRFQPAGGRLALLAGGGHAWTRTWQDPAQSGRPPIWREGPTATVGADVTAINRPRVALAGSFRVRWASRDLDFGDGFGELTYQLGVTLFAR